MRSRWTVSVITFIISSLVFQAALADEKPGTSDMPPQVKRARRIVFLGDSITHAGRYIEEVERNRDSIIVKDGCDPLKIRARVIIGRDGDEAQQRALRNFNGHLHRVEVLTFDQLLRIADRVLSVFEDKLSKAAS